MDLFSLIPLVIALVVFWKLRSVLGSRTGSERPPFDPYSPDRNADSDDVSNDNVITLPGARGRDEEDAEPRDPVELAIEKISGKNKKLAKGLKGIWSKDANFDPNQFIEGAKMAYEMIVTAFADGDKKSLKGLLSREVYENFASAIDERSKRSERLQSSFVGIEKADITSAEMNKNEALITVSFVSQMISATLDASGEVIDGDVTEVAEVVDIWTFARSTRARDPNWKLVATDD